MSSSALFILRSTPTASAPIRDTTMVSIDEKKFAGKAYSIVYQYLSQYSSSPVVSANTSSDMVKTFLL